jgi:UDP-glucose 4-epimerase
MTRILVTGGAGNIGASLVERLVSDPENYVVVLDNLSTGKFRNLSTAAKRDNYKFIKCDVNVLEDIMPVMTAYRFDYVFHYAAVVGVQRTLDHPVQVLRDIDGIKHILSLSKNTGVRRVFYSSSSEVYGEPVEIPQHEKTTPLNSRLPYAIVKNLGEAFCQSYFQEYGLNYTIFRFFNTYGPLQSSDFVLTKFINAALKNEPLTIYGDGSQSRTFCYIDDNMELTMRALKEGHFTNDVVNVGNDVEISILSLAKMVISALGSTSSVEHLPPLKEGDMTRRKPDISKMKQVLGRDLTPLGEGIRRVADALKSQR